MKNENITEFLERLTYSNLKELYKRLSGAVPKAKTKREIISEILKLSSSKEILDLLGIENQTVDESVSIAQKSLKNQSISNFIAALGIIVTIILAIFINKGPSENNEGSAKYTLDTTRTAETDLCLDCFPKDSNYHILILPFGSSQNCNDLSVICEREVMSRLSIVSDSNGINDLEIAVLNDAEIDGEFINQKKAEEIGKSKNAHIVIWGSYLNKCDWDSTKIRLNWVSLTKEKLFHDKNIKYDYTTVDEISQIEQGILTGDVEELVYYLIGMKNYYKKKYKNALKYFYNIKIKQKSEYTKLLFLIGECYFAEFRESKSNIDSCIANYNKALNLDSVYFPTYERLAYLYDRLREDNMSLKALKTGLRLANTSDAYSKWHYLQAFNIKLGIHFLKDTTLSSLNSIKYFEEAINLNPERLEIYHLITYAYLKNEKYDLAIEHCCKVQGKFPNDVISSKIIESSFKTAEEKYPDVLVKLLNKKANLYISVNVRRDTIYKQDTIYKRLYIYKRTFPAGIVRYDTVETFTKEKPEK